MAHCFWFPSGTTVSRTSTRSAKKPFAYVGRKGSGSRPRSGTHREQRAPHGPLASIDFIANSRSGGGDYAALERKVADLQHEALTLEARQQQKTESAPSSAP